MNVGINPIHKALQSSCHSSALVPSLIPGFAALRYLSVFLISLVQDPNILLLSFGLISGCTASGTPEQSWDLRGVWSVVWSLRSPRAVIVLLLKGSCQTTVFFCRVSGWTSTVFLLSSLFVGFSPFSPQLWDPWEPLVFIASSWESSE